ncbi:hypothetical protein ACEWY4_023380 [Coilia grayii]|uniref:BED-type domain-containing protein n=1 Tax=Coilia grayii TaxID=363190 RepID=A0ABD1J2V8_9TELE
MAEGGQSRLVDKKGKRSSLVWEHFGFEESDEKQQRIMCKICYKVISAPLGNTTNLFNHLKQKHKVTHDELIKKQKDKISATTSKTSMLTQSSITDTMFNATSYPTSSERHKTLTAAVGYFLAKDMQPINTVEGEGFKRMLIAFDKRYALPSRHHFNRMVLPNMYQQCRDKVTKEVSAADEFAATTDLWSSRTMEPYISLTIHFIDTEFNLKVKCLQTAFMPEDHTGQNIADGLREALAEWGLNEGKLVCITTDNAANIKLAAEINGWLRLQCFGHRLHLAIENAMKDHRICRAMGVCKKLVSSFTYSWKKKRDLEEVQKQLSLPKHSLKTECPTRWGSRQAMIDRILEQQKAIAQVLSNDRKLRHLIPSWQDIDVLEAVIKSLSPLVEFTDALSGEKYVSVSLVKPTLHLFNNSILEDQEDDTQLAKTIKHNILQYLNDKYSDQQTQEILDMASALDPRFKLKYVDEDIKEYILERLKIEMRDVKTASAMRAPFETTAQVVDTEDAVPSMKRKKGLGSFFKVTADKAAGPPPHKDQAIASEIQSYFQTESLDPEDDPLTWWRDAKTIYPRLSVLARKYLCIPATSSSSERVFSTSGNIVSCLRSSLKPDHVNRLVFLAKNL